MRSADARAAIGTGRPVLRIVATMGIQRSRTCDGHVRPRRAQCRAAVVINRKAMFGTALKRGGAAIVQHDLLSLGYRLLSDSWSVLGPDER